MYPSLEASLAGRCPNHLQPAALLRGGTRYTKHSRARKSTVSYSSSMVVLSPKYLHLVGYGLRLRLSWTSTAYLHTKDRRARLHMRVLVQDAKISSCQESEAPKTADHIAHAAARLAQC
jgi:hypothetical protein